MATLNLNGEEIDQFTYDPNTLCNQYGGYEYEIYKNDKLGEGSFGGVYGCEIKKDGNIQKGCAKVIKKFYDGKREIEITNQIKNISHPNIVRIYQISYPPEQAVILMERCDNDLSREQQKQLTQERIIEIISQILEGLTVLHNLKIVHRDLKPDNILFKGGQAKIADFGISKIIQQGETKHTAIGTKNYASPQVILDDDHTEKADIYSIGAISHYLFYGAPPIETIIDSEFNKLLAEYKKKSYQCKANPKILPKIPELINKMLKFYECERISLQELKNEINELKKSQDPNNQQYLQSVVLDFVYPSKKIKTEKLEELPYFTDSSKFKKFLDFLLYKGKVALQLSESFKNVQISGLTDFELLLVQTTLITYNLSMVKNVQKFLEKQFNTIGKHITDVFNISKSKTPIHHVISSKNLNQFSDYNPKESEKQQKAFVEQLKQHLQNQAIPGWEESKKEQFVNAIETPNTDYKCYHAYFKHFQEVILLSKVSYSKEKEYSKNYLQYLTIHQKCKRLLYSIYTFGDSEIDLDIKKYLDINIQQSNETNLSEMQLRDFLNKKAQTTLSHTKN